MHATGRGRTRGAIAAALACCSLLAGPAGPRASTTPPEVGTGAHDDATEPAERVRERDSLQETRVVGIGRVRVSHPQKLSGAFGALVVRQPQDYDCTTICDFRGLLLQAEPGLAGGQISAGYAVVVGEKRHSDFFITEVFMGYGVKAALLRTWGDSPLTPPEQTLLGVEGDFTIIQLNFSLGLFRHFAGGDPDQRWQLAGGVGWGF